MSIIIRSDFQTIFFWGKQGCVALMCDVFAPKIPKHGVRGGDFFSWPGGGGGTKCEERGRSDVMSQNVFLGGGEKKIRIIIALTCYMQAPRNRFSKLEGGGGGIKYLRSDRAKQLSWV